MQIRQIIMQHKTAVVVNYSHKNISLNTEWFIIWVGLLSGSSFPLKDKACEIQR